MTLDITAEEQKAYETKNAEMVKKYPALALVFKDPDAFMSDCQGRFAKQKALTPDDPYAFDFSDFGVPMCKDLHTALGNEIEKVQAQQDKIQKGQTSWVPTCISGENESEEDHKIGLIYLKDLQSEMAGITEKGQISYKRTQELGYFASRALGFFDEGDINLRDRIFLKADRFLQGHEGVTIAEEYSRYRNNEFSVFQKPSPVGGFAVCDKPFTDAYFNKEKLEFLSLPTIHSLGSDVFMRLAPYEIFITGMTPEPAPADGFVRPGADFNLHDQRHNSAIYFERKNYKVKNNLTEAHVKKIAKHSDLWKLELDADRKKLPTKEMRYATGFFMFNFHHDRGYPLLPSSYENTKLDYVPKLLYGMLKVSKQPTGFPEMNKTLKEAHNYLQTWWVSRMDEEKAIINCQPESKATAA